MSPISSVVCTHGEQRDFLLRPPTIPISTSETLMAHGHSHSAAHHPQARAGARHEGRLRWAFALVVGFLGVQVVVGFATGSLALLSDAGHMATDALGLGMALAAIHVADRPGQATHRTFGLYRMEILAALANAVLLFAVAAFVVVTAVGRLHDPPQIASRPVLVVGVIGLVLNLIAFMILRPGAAESMNVRGAYLEVMADALGSMVVIVSAGLMSLTGWGWVDPVAGSLIGIWILPRAFGLGRDAVRVLVQAAPAHLDVDELIAGLAAIEGVVNVHDLHVWTLTSEMEVLTAHLAVRDATSTSAVLDQARAVLADRFGLRHATLQVEHGVSHECDEMTW
jgi:cobalt-zinc-cadmium efflux system protein